MTGCTCPSSVTSRGRFTTRHNLHCPNRPAFCAGHRRPPHLARDVQPRPPTALPLCPTCHLDATTQPHAHTTRTPARRPATSQPTNTTDQRTESDHEKPGHDRPGAA